MNAESKQTQDIIVTPHQPNGKLAIVGHLAVLKRISKQLGDALFTTSDGEDHSKSHRILMPAFSPRSVSSLVGIILLKTDILLDQLKALPYRRRAITNNTTKKAMSSPLGSLTSPNHHQIGKRPAESKAEVVYKIFPNDLNSEGTVFGGVVLSLMDRTALVVAERHSGKSCVTVSIDSVRFLAPGRKGDNLICTAVITRSWTSSMEIDLKVIAEHPFSGETKEILEAFFTFCAFDQWGKPTKIPVPAVIPDTKEEHHRYQEAGIRMEERSAATKGRKERKASFLANGRKKPAVIQRGTPAA